MAANRIRKLGDKIRGSGFVLYLSIILVIGCLATVITSVNDFYTSYIGVANLAVNITTPEPTGFETALAGLRRVAVAVMPQVITVIAGYVVIAFEAERGNKREWGLWIGALVIFCVAAAIDIGTGYFYYIMEPYGSMSLGSALATEAGRSTVFHSLFMSAIVDTGFSEIGSAFLWGLFLDLYPDAMKQWQKVLGSKNSLASVPKPKKKREGRENDIPPPPNVNRSSTEPRSISAVPPRQRMRER